MTVVGFRLQALGFGLSLLGVGSWESGVVSVSARQLLDRVVARVDGYAITLSDVRAAVALGIVESPSAGDEAVAINQLVDRELVRAEVARFAPPEPPPGDVNREMKAMIDRVGDRLGAMMATTGIDEGRIREMARDNLRIASYMNQRFGTAAQLSEDEVLQYYVIHPDEFTRGGRQLPFAEVEPVARQRAAAERRASSVAQWIRDLRNRAEIVFPDKP